jgi:hypothetical protein
MQKYEYIWRVFFVVVLVVAALLFRKVYIFQTHDHFASVREGNVTEMLLYGLPFAVLFTVGLLSLSCSTCWSTT